MIGCSMECGTRYEFISLDGTRSILRSEPWRLIPRFTDVVMKPKGKQIRTVETIFRCGEMVGFKWIGDDGKVLLETF